MYFYSSLHVCCFYSRRVVVKIRAYLMMFRCMYVQHYLCFFTSPFYLNFFLSLSIFKCNVCLLRFFSVIPIFLLSTKTAAVCVETMAQHTKQKKELEGKDNEYNRKKMLQRHNLGNFFFSLAAVHAEETLNHLIYLFRSLTLPPWNAIFYALCVCLRYVKTNAVLN